MEETEIELSKENFEKWSQQVQPKSQDTIIEMSNLQDRSNNENSKLIKQIQELQEETSQVTDEIESTYLLDNTKMINYLSEKNRHIQDKQTIYEYYYENLNEQYTKLNIFLIVISSIVTLLGSAQLGDFWMSDIAKTTFKILVIVFSFIITVLSSVLKFKLYKEKIESIGKYMEQLELLIDEIEIFCKHIETGTISDQQFFDKLNEITTVVTRTNTKMFNIRSDNYYRFYRKLKLIASNKWNIQHEIKTNNEKRYNEFLKQRLATMTERLELKKKFTTIENEVTDIQSFYNNDIFSLQQSNDNKEE